MWTLLWALALQPPTDDGPRTAATLGPIDLDGDRQRESVRQTDAGVVVERATVPCGSVASPCELEVHDIRMEDRRRELLLCERQGESRSCRLFTMRDKALRELKLVVSPSVQKLYPSERLRAPGISTRGDGSLVAHMPGGVCPRDESFRWVGDRLEHQPRTAYPCEGLQRWGTAGSLLASEPQGSEGLRLDAAVSVTVIEESAAQPGWVRVQLEDGRSGWAKAESLRTDPPE